MGLTQALFRPTDVFNEGHHLRADDPKPGCMLFHVASGSRMNDNRGVSLCHGRRVAFGSCCNGFVMEAACFFTCRSKFQQCMLCVPSPWAIFEPARPASGSQSVLGVQGHALAVESISSTLTTAIWTFRARPLWFCAKSAYHLNIIARSLARTPPPTDDAGIHCNLLATN